MCLVVVAIGRSTAYPLILAGNRDEFHARPSAEADWWTDHPDIVGGRDLQAGGTWLALHRHGRFATVTNYRDAELPARGLRSRGHLVADFLEADSSPQEYLENIDGSAYAGFNLIVGDTDNIAYCSNRGAGVRLLGNGVYGLSNALLDGSWDKVERSKQRLDALIESKTLDDERLLDMLSDRRPGQTDSNEAARLGDAAARAITAPFIVTPEYGTRCSTIVTRDADGRWHLVERRFDADGCVTGQSRFSLPSGG